MTTRHWFRNFWGRTTRRPTRPRKPSRTRTRLHCEEFEPRTLLAATQFSVVPSMHFVNLGVPFSVTVTAEDAAGHPVNYLGPIHFSSDDTQATLPGDYTFTAADHGTHTFSGVVIRNFRGVVASVNVTNGGIGSVTLFDEDLNHNGGPHGITVGQDGNLWYTAQNANEIRRITPTGTITRFPIPTPNSAPQGIAAGPDGNLWFTEGGANKVGKISYSGVITEYSTSGGTSGITYGGGPNLWFTDNGSNKIGTISPPAAVNEYPIPTAGSDPVAITMGPDGNLWFVENLGFKIGKMAPGGVFTEYRIPDGSPYPEGIVAGPDGNLWFTDSFYGKIGKITPAGAITEYPLFGGIQYPDWITAGPDGNLWFTENYPGNNKVGWITPAGAITEYAVGTIANPQGIVAGPDGNLWFTESGTNAVGRINSATIAGSATVYQPDRLVVTTTAGNPDVAGTPFSVTVTAQSCFAGRCTTDTGFPDAVHFTSSDSAATLPANYAFTAADHGVHTFSGVILRTAGGRSITATDTLTASVTGSAGVNVGAAAASQLVVSTSAANPGVAGTPFNVTVTARDVYGNTATGYTGTVHFSSGDPYGATLPPNYTFTAADQGVHTFAAGATLFTAATTAIAYANGFGDPSALTANGNTTFPGTPAVLRLTDGGGGEASSAWANRPVGLGAFTTTFTLQDQPVTGAADGVCFVLQADPRGTAALGAGGGRRGLRRHRQQHRHQVRPLHPRQP